MLRVQCFPDDVGRALGIDRDGNLTLRHTLPTSAWAVCADAERPVASVDEIASVFRDDAELLVVWKTVADDVYGIYAQEPVSTWWNFGAPKSFATVLSVPAELVVFAAHDASIEGRAFPVDAPGGCGRMDLGVWLNGGSELSDAILLLRAEGKANDDGIQESQPCEHGRRRPRVPGLWPPGL